MLHTELMPNVSTNDLATSGFTPSRDERVRAFLQELQALQTLLVVDADQPVHVQYIVNPRDMFVADAFDGVRPEPRVVQRRTLDRLEADDLAVGELLLQEVAGPIVPAEPIAEAKAATLPLPTPFTTSCAA